MLEKYLHPMNERKIKEYQVFIIIEELKPVLKSVAKRLEEL